MTRPPKANVLPPPALARSEHSLAWDLRGAWAEQRPVVLMLSPRCMIDRVQGLVSYVAVTGAYCVVDGWHVPTADVLTVLKPHHSQQEAPA